MDRSHKVELPSSTAWPFVLAVGLTLVCAGMVTALSVTVLGAVLAVSAAVGWFRQVLPAESHECVTAVEQEVAFEKEPEVDLVPVPRPCLPVEIFPVSAGIKGGLAGGAVMAGLAALYGAFSGNGIWYAMNLLVAGFFSKMATETAGQIGTFDLHRFLLAVPIHLLISVLVGLLYGSMLPMLPRSPILLGGFIAPILWSLLICGGLAFINPVLNLRIDWFWFVLSQVGFGVVAGLVVRFQQRLPTNPGVPLILRMGIEASGVPRNREDAKR